MSVPSPGSPYPYNVGPQIDIGWLTRGWDQFKEKAGTWVGAMLVFGLILLAVAVPLAFVTGYAQIFLNIYAPILHPGTQPTVPANPFAYQGSGLLFGVGSYLVSYLFLAGLYQMALRQLRGETISIGDLFAGFRHFLPLLAAAFLVYLCVTIGSFLCLLPGLIAQGLFMFVPLLILDRNTGPVQALSESFALLKGQWLMASVFFFLGQLLAGAGGLLCGVGALVTYPLFILGVTMAYLTFTNPQTPPTQPDYGPSTPGVWPPPPGSDPTW